MMNYLARSKTIGRAETDLLSQYKREVDYRKKCYKQDCGSY